MQIIINGKQAVIKKGTSFEYIVENSQFTGADSYTLAISFPLNDCPTNREIFGFLQRMDVEKSKVMYDCEIRDKDFSKVGYITITEVSESEVKAQFLEGRSAQNYDESFDDIFINELALGYPDVRPTNHTPSEAWRPGEAVALPWVNNTSGNLQNEVVIENGAYRWATSLKLSWQPYLLHIMKKVCEAIGYTYDFTEIERSEYKFLIICNALPSAWEILNFAAALPHWSVTEFLEELEKFLYGEFFIDHRTRHIAFRFSTRLLAEMPKERVETVVNEYTTDISQENDCDYIGAQNIMYAENDNRCWAYRSCQWFIDARKNEARVFDTLSELLQFARTLKMSGYYETVSPRGGVQGKYMRGYPPDSEGNRLFYARDVDTYFIMFCYKSEFLKTTTIREVEYNWYKYTNRLEPINQFGKRLVDKEAEDIEMNIVPAWIDDTDDDHGPCIFLECGEMGSTSYVDDDELATGSSGRYHASFGGSAAEAATTREADDTDYNDGRPAQSRAGRLIERGEQETADAYFDQMYVGFWDGASLGDGKQPFPIIDCVMTKNDFTALTFPYSLRINHITHEIDRTSMHKIDGKHKYHFSFISRVIPDARALFWIRGAWYICEKITVNFKEEGRSELLKGVFYRVI